ncbi:MAG: family 16 glycosylhydrolase [Lachnospiraceae bacterium]|nr:family 16 glycosylhydrolase [Lachnospiraceae bacterium]
MKKRVFSILFILLMIAVLSPREGLKAATDDITFDGKRYTLAFSDEFDFFDHDKWAYCPEIKRQDLGGEWQDSCSTVEDGNLVITCSAADDGKFVSGGIRSTSEYEQAFGLYHMRFKAEKADGLWYAFWLLTDRMEEGSVGNGAADGAEIDIFELVPYAKDFCTSVHWDGYGDELKSCCEFIDEIDDSFFDVYHDIWFLWNAEGYRVYLDGTGKDCLKLDLPGNEYGDGTCAVPCDMIISAEYGTWGGAIDRSQLPAHLYVDFVRIYKETGNDDRKVTVSGGEITAADGTQTAVTVTESIATDSVTYTGQKITAKTLGAKLDISALKGITKGSLKKGKAKNLFKTKWILKNNTEPGTGTIYAKLVFDSKKAKKYGMTKSRITEIRKIVKALNAALKKDPLRFDIIKE